jgi:hypothetical protein
MSLPKTIPGAPPLPKFVTVPPASDVHLVYGQEVTFQSMQQNWTICFASDSKWPQLSGKSYSNQSVSGTAPQVDTDIPYNVVTSGTCVPVSSKDVGATIHVRSTGLHKVQG